MLNKKKDLNWCVRINGGLKIMEPDLDLAKSYLEQAKLSLKRAEKNLNEGDLLWATVVLYYAEYYSLYSFLQRIGVKYENHFCPILTVEKLLGVEKVNTIILHKSKRIDAQYYMKIVSKERIEEMLKEGKIFVSDFDNLVLNLSEKEIDFYRSKFNGLIRGENDT